MRLLMTAALAAAFCALAACNPATTSTTVTETSSASSTATTTAAAESYVGTWAATAAACGIPQEQEGAPYVFSHDGYDQHEAHCTIAASTQTGPNSWHMAYACQVEGDEQSSGADISVDGDTMTMDGQHLVRCP